MSIINNILWAFAEDIKSNATSLNDIVIRKLMLSEPEINWIDFESNANQLIRHLSFVYQNPEMYLTPRLTDSVLGCLELNMAICSKEMKRDYF